MIPGMTFLLAIGARIPREMLKFCAAPAASCYIVINTTGELNELKMIAKIANSLKPPRGYEGS